MDGRFKLSFAAMSDSSLTYRFVRAGSSPAMASIGEVYDAQSRGMVEPGQLRLGFGLFLSGIILAAVGLVVATTGVHESMGLSIFDARLYAGILGGLAVPLALLGIMLLFPTDRRAWGVAAIGTGIAALGVAFFWYAYPQDWAGYGRDFTPIVSAIYAFGIVTVTWSLFTTVATFKRRNDPGGTVTLQIAPETGIPRLFRVAREGLRHSSFGGGTLFSSTPPGASGQTGGGSTTTSPSTQQAVGVTDGGETEVAISEPRDPEPVDRYCGNCRFFAYGSDDHGKLSPYCRHHDEAMDDMEPCDDWQSNTAS